MSPFAHELIDLIAPLVEVEKQSVHCDTAEEYRALIAANQETNDHALAEARAYVMDCRLTLPDLQEVFHEVVNSDAYSGLDDEDVVRGAVGGILNRAFKGVAGWRY